MPKHCLQKLWQKAHKNKVNQYHKKYLKNKVRVDLVLDKGLVERIDKVKRPDENYASWIKRISQEWLNEHT